MLRKFLFYIILSLMTVVVLSQQPQFSIQALFGPTWYVMNDYEYSDSKQKFNYSVGGYFMFNIPVGKSSLSFRSGYFYDTKNYSIDYTKSFVSTQRVERNYSYGNVPILIEVRFSVRDKLYPFLSTGLVFGNLLTAKQTTFKTDGSVQEGFGGFKAYNQEKQTDFHICSGLGFRMSKSFVLRFEFYVSGQVNMDTGYNTDRFGGLSYGIKTGLQFDIYYPEKWLD